MQQSLGLSDEEFRGLWEREMKNPEGISKDPVCSGSEKVSSASPSSTGVEFGLVPAIHR